MLTTGPIIQLDLSKNLVNKYDTFESIPEHFDVRRIKECLTGRQKSYKEFLWEFENDKVSRKSSHTEKTRKEKVIKHVQSVKEFVKKNNRLPKSREEPFPALRVLKETYGDDSTLNEFEKTLRAYIDENLPNGWSGIKKQKIPESFDTTLVNLKEYVKQHNSIPNKEEDAFLGEWVMKQRGRKNGTKSPALTKEQIEQLESVRGWKWIE